VYPSDRMAWLARDTGRRQDGATNMLGERQGFIFGTNTVFSIRDAFRDLEVPVIASLQITSLQIHWILLI
jgi:hypothetical protein